MAFPGAHYQLTSGTDSTDLSSYTTASITPAGNRLVYIVVGNTLGTGTPIAPTVTGCGITWVQVATRGIASAIRATIFRGMVASPSAGALTIDFAGATQTSCTWSVGEFDLVDTTGTHGSGAIVQSVNSTGETSATSGAVTLAAFGHADNATFGTFFHRANEATTPGSGFTELVDISSSAPIRGLQVEWRLDNDTSVDASWTTSSGWVGLAVEIKASPDATAAPSSVVIVGAVPAPTVATGAVLTPPSVSAVAAAGSPTVTAGCTVAPTAVVALATVPAPVAAAGATVASSTTAGIAAVPAPTIDQGAGPITVPASSVPAVAAVGVPAVDTAAIASPATVAAIAAVGAPSVSTGAIVAPVSVVAVAAVGASPPNTGALVVPSAVATTASVPSPTVTAHTVVPAGSVAVTGAIGVPSLAVGAVVTVATVSTAAVVGAPAVVIAGGGGSHYEGASRLGAFTAGASQILTSMEGGRA